MTDSTRTALMVTRPGERVCGDRLACEAALPVGTREMTLPTSMSGEERRADMDSATSEAGGHALCDAVAMGNDPSALTASSSAVTSRSVRKVMCTSRASTAQTAARTQRDNQERHNSASACWAETVS